MKTLSLEQAVFEVIKDFDNNGQPFSAHDITTIVRNNVNSKAVEILNVPYGYVDATNTHSQHVNHVDVRDIIREMVDNKEVDVVSKGAYTIYRYKTIVPVIGTMPVLPKIVNIPTTSAAPMPRKNLADLIASVTDNNVTTSPAVTGVPSRFLNKVDIKDDIKQRVTKYIRYRLNRGETPTIRETINTVRRGTNVYNVMTLAEDEGWSVVNNTGNPLAGCGSWTIQ